MGYDIVWGLRRREPLDARDLDKLAGHIDKWSRSIIGYRFAVWKGAPVDRWIVTGTLRPAARGGYSSEVVEEVFEAMEQLRSLIGDAELVLSDDFYRYVWTGRGFEPRDHDSVTPPRPGPGWTMLEGHAKRDNEEDEADDEDDGEGEFVDAGPARIDSMSAAELLKTFDDASQSEARRLEALEHLALKADKDRRLVLGVIERERGKRPDIVARILKKLAKTQVRPCPTAMLALDDGIPGAIELWAHCTARDAGVLLPWLPATTAGRALAWIHALRAPEIRDWLGTRGEDPIDVPFGALVEVAQTADRARTSSGAGIFDDFDELAVPSIRDAVQKLATVLDAFEARGAPVRQQASDGDALLRYVATGQGKRPVFGWAVSELARGLAIAAGAEQLQSFLSPYARKTLLDYEMAMGRPTEKEIAQGLSPGSLGSR